MILKIWDFSDDSELNATYSISSGSGAFDDLFTAVEEIYFSSDDGGDDGGAISDGCALPNNTFYLNGGNVLYN